MCTTFRMRAEDDSIVVGRTMEFGADLGWEILAIGRGAEFTGTAPDGPGRTWTADHSLVGVGALGRNSATDGINDAGLYAGLLYLPGFAEYEDHTGVEASDLISADEVASLVLATSATVDEAVAAIESVVVWNRLEDALGGSILPIHLILHDRSGAAAVIEWVGGERTVHINELGVATNAPPFEWHLLNRRNFVNLSATNVPPLEIEGHQIRGLGEGTGLLGLPGDWTPPSRFVRATALTAAAHPGADADAAMLNALHIVNSFDIPKGLIRGGPFEDFTCWSTVCDLAGGRYAIRAYDDPSPRLVEIAGLELTDGEVRHMAMPADARILPYAA